MQKGKIRAFVQQGARWALILFTVSLAINFNAALAGIIIEEVGYPEGQEGSAIKSKSYYSSNCVKLVSDEDVTIINLKKDTITLVNLTEKNYCIVTREEYANEMRKLFSRLSEALDEMKQEMQKMPEEERALVELMMGIKQAAGVVNIAAKETNESDTIAGYKSKKFEVRAADNQELRQEVWVSPDLAKTLENEVDYKVFAEFFSIAQEALRAMAAYSTAANPAIL